LSGSLRGAAAVETAGSLATVSTDSRGIGNDDTSQLTSDASAQDLVLDTSTPSDCHCHCHCHCDSHIMIQNHKSFSRSHTVTVTAAAAAAAAGDAQAVTL
jgi:hypothetical protein